MNTYTMSCCLVKQKSSHKALDVAQCLQNLFEHWFGLNLIIGCYSAASDTTGSTKNVAPNLDANQENCELHVLSLTIETQQLQASQLTSIIGLLWFKGWFTHSHKGTLILTPYLWKANVKASNLSHNRGPETLGLGRERGCKDVRERFRYHFHVIWWV